MPTQWKDDIPVRVFEMVIRGLSKQQVADALEIDLDLFNAWIQHREVLRDSIKRARAFLLDTKGQNAKANPAPLRKFDLVEYSYHRLPPELREVWELIEAAVLEPNPVKRYEELMANQGEVAKKYLYIHALSACNFNKQEACRRVCISVHEANEWVRQDPEFGQMLLSMEDIKEDWLEGCLLQLVADGDTTATIFCARSKLRKRGYDPKVTVEHQGKVLHGHVDLDSLNLDLETRRRLLQAIRQGSEVNGRDALPPREVDADEDE